MNTDKKILIPFLKTLANALETNILSQSQIQQIGEFHMTFQYNNQTQILNENELLKYIVLGWYIYTQIIEKNNYSIE